MFKVGEIYQDRTGKSFTCVRPIFGSLPEFENETGRIVRAPDGKYRFDSTETNKDILKEF